MRIWRTALSGVYLGKFPAEAVDVGNLGRVRHGDHVRTETDYFAIFPVQCDVDVVGAARQDPGETGEVGEGCQKGAGNMAEA